MEPGTHHEEKATAGRKVGAGVHITVESPSFDDGQPIPKKHAGAQGRSPALRWSPPPPGTRELVLLVEDPDAPQPKPFVHWIVTGLLPDTQELAEGKEGWYGPEPPPGHGVHHYHFQLFALDRRLGAPGDRDRLVQALRDHVIGWGELVGTYQR